MWTLKNYIFYSFALALTFTIGCCPASHRQNILTGQPSEALSEAELRADLGVWVPLLQSAMNQLGDPYVLTSKLIDLRFSTTYNLEHMKCELYIHVDIRKTRGTWAEYPLFRRNTLVFFSDVDCENISPPGIKTGVMNQPDSPKNRCRHLFNSTYGLNLRLQQTVMTFYLTVKPQP